MIKSFNKKLLSTVPAEKYNYKGIYLLKIIYYLSDEVGYIYTRDECVTCKKSIEQFQCTNNTASSLFKPQIKKLFNH